MTVSHEREVDALNISLRETTVTNCPRASFHYGRICEKRAGDEAMPWSEAYYPRSMRNLPLEVRLKAIEIANALLEEGYDEGKAIRIGIAKAKEWAERGE
jgi:hypothetical protein